MGLNTRRKILFVYYTAGLEPEKLKKKKIRLDSTERKAVGKIALLDECC